MVTPSPEEKDEAMASLVAALERFRQAFDAWASEPPESPDRARLREVAEACLEETRAAVERVEALAAREKAAGP